ncbi:MAG: alpha/beta fold hydrolase [Actinomycetota bacterium]|nr:MAG: alpha/beta fold hydrolase [Actinomycetota bacterium]
MPLLPGAEPFRGGDGPVGVLLVHGFTGSPASMLPWATYLVEQGFTVSAPRLPGHGTRWQDMNATRWQDWYAEVERAYLALREVTRAVAVGGLSMGGTLALRLAQRHPREVAGLVLVNPSVFTERKDRFALPAARFLLPSVPGVANDIKRAGVDEIAYDRTPLRAAYSLSQLWSVVRADLGTVVAPVLVFRSEVDHVVEASNTAYILDHVSSTDTAERVLHDSFHVATLDNDAAEIFSGSSDFIDRVTAGVRDG